MNINSPLRLMPLLLLIVAVVSCGTPEPRQVPFPILNPVAPFTFKGKPDKAASPMSEEDGEVAQMLREVEGDVPTASPSAGRQTVLLAGRFASEIPLAFEEWRWATDGDVTLVAHFTDGRVDGLIYAESFGFLTKLSPTEESRRFLSTVDSRLNGPLALLNSIFSLAARGVAMLVGGISGNDSSGHDGDSADPSKEEIESIAGALMAAISRTGGQGFGYRSTDGSFSGWKWIGRSDSGLSFRLARTTGIWGKQGTGSLVSIGDAVKNLDFLKPVLSYFGGGFPSSQSSPQQATDKGEVPAWMVLGSVVLEGDIGIHIAFLCAREPDCSVTEEFVDFVENMRLPSRAAANAAQGSGSATSLEELSTAIGLRIAPGSLMMDPGKMVDLVREGMKSAQDDGASQGTPDMSTGALPSVPSAPINEAPVSPVGTREQEDVYGAGTDR